MDEDANSVDGNRGWWWKMNEKKPIITIKVLEMKANL